MRASERKLAYTNRRGCKQTMNETNVAPRAVRRVPCASTLTLVCRRTATSSRVRCHTTHSHMVHSTRTRACQHTRERVGARIRTRRMRACVHECMQSARLHTHYFKIISNTTNLKVSRDQESKDRDVSISRPYSHQISTATSPAQTRGGTSARARTHTQAHMCVSVWLCVSECVWVSVWVGEWGVG